MVVFKEKTSYAFSNIQLKNKWDSAKNKLEDLEKIDF
jgi:catabolite regulation protein CreA